MSCKVKVRSKAQCSCHLKVLIAMNLYLPLEKHTNPRWQAQGHTLYPRVHASQTKRLDHSAPQDSMSSLFG